MPAISKEFGIDAAAQGVILSSFFWTYAFMQIPGGCLADRYRPRLGTIAAGLFAYWYIRDNPREQPSTNEAEALYIETEHAKEDQALATPAAGRTNLLGFLRFRSVWGMLLGWLGFDLVFYVLVAWAPNYLAQAPHLTLSPLGRATHHLRLSRRVGE